MSYKTHRVQVSLNFDDENTIETYNKVVVPLRENKQLRNTIIDLLSLYRDRPLEIEALLNGENLVAQDEYAREFMTSAQSLEINLNRLENKMNNLHHNLDESLSGGILQNLSVNQSPIDSQSGVLSPTTKETQQLPDLSELKQELTREIMSAVLPSMKNMLDDFTKSISAQSNTDLEIPKYTSNTTSEIPQYKPTKASTSQSVPNDSDNVSTETKPQYRILDLEEEDETPTKTEELGDDDSLDEDFIVQMMAQAADSSLG